jgi:predicted KAP-like P-loop ATPase
VAARNNNAKKNKKKQEQIYENVIVSCDVSDLWCSSPCSPIDAFWRVNKTKNRNAMILWELK